MFRGRVDVAFDTAGGHRAGVGHVVRALALAARVEQLGARVTAIAPATASALASRALPITTRRPDVVAIDRPDTTADLLRRHNERWPGIRLVALDYYGESVDGLAAVVNLNEARERGAARRPRAYYRGLRYAVLRASFRQRRRVRTAVPARVRRILVGFGGTDPSGWTTAAVRALVPILSSAAMDIDILSGRPFPAGALDGVPRVTLHVAVADPSALLQASDLVIIGGGTMMIEAACLGVPAIVIPRTLEERAFARQFTRVGAVRVLAPRAAFPGGALRREAARLFDDRHARLRMRRAGRALVDGRGAERVARLILKAGRVAA